MRNENESFWRSKVVKGVYVGIFTLAMGIPLIFVSNLVDERQQRKSEVVAEVTNQWSNAQEIKSIFVMIPYVESVAKESIIGGKKVTSIEKLRGRLFISPKTMKVVGKVSPEIRKKGIYEVVVYNSNFEISGEFVQPDLPLAESRAYDKSKAEIFFGVNDIRGLQEEVIVNFGDQKLSLGNSEMDSYLSQNIPIALESGEKVNYSLNLTMRGSNALSFVPTAANTKIELSSPWQSPGFFGAFLPSHEIDKSGFKAK
jgi:inner membrane protein